MNGHSFQNCLKPVLTDLNEGNKDMRLVDLLDPLPLINGELTVIAGKANSEISNLAISIASEVAFTKVPTIYYSFKDNETNLCKRIIAIISDVPKYQLHNLQLDIGEKKKIIAAIEATKEENFPFFLNCTILDDSDNLQSEFVSEKGSFFQQLKKIGKGVLFIDGIQMIPSKTGRKIYESVSDVFRFFKNVANTAQIPVIVTVPLSTRPGNPCVQLSDLHEFGLVEQIADNILLLTHNDEWKYKEKAIISVEKTSVHNKPFRIMITYGKNFQGFYRTEEDKPFFSSTWH